MQKRMGCDRGIDDALNESPVFGARMLELSMEVVHEYRDLEIGIFELLG
jgi:hypothetical protein